MPLPEHLLPEILMQALCGTQEPEFSYGHPVQCTSKRKGGHGALVMKKTIRSELTIKGIRTLKTLL